MNVPAETTQFWSDVKHLDTVASPGLLVDAERVKHNIEQMVQLVGGAEMVSRLRPHVKTHKMPEVIRLQLEAGIYKFKVATLAEVEMVAQAGGRDILLAYQPVGPNLQRLARLVKQFPQASFATVVDDVAVLRNVATELGDLDQPFRVFIDVDCGMHRTGIELGDSFVKLRDQIEAVPGILYQGLHVYDGHIHDADFEVRRQRSQAVIAFVSEYQRTNPSPVIIGGGSPTFPFWAQSPWECSPGTPVFWDRGYSGGYPELPFKTAVVLITRVISRPVQDRLCLDLGYKSVAAEMPLDIRLFLPQIPEAKFVGHSEEHLVIETPRAKDFAVGEILLAYPKHICPTVALHAFATVVRNQEVTHEIWRVTARDR